MRMREIAKERKKTAYIAASNKTFAEPRNSQYLKLIILLSFYEVAVHVRQLFHQIENKHRSFTVGAAAILQLLLVCYF